MEREDDEPCTQSQPWKIFNHKIKFINVEICNHKSQI